MVIAKHLCFYFVRNLNLFHLPLGHTNVELVVDGSLDLCYSGDKNEVSIRQKRIKVVYFTYFMQTFIINILIFVIAETARKSKIFIILHLNGGSLVKN